MSIKVEIHRGNTQYILFLSTGIYILLSFICHYLHGCFSILQRRVRNKLQATERYINCSSWYLFCRTSYKTGDQPWYCHFHFILFTLFFPPLNNTSLISLHFTIATKHSDDQSRQHPTGHITIQGSDSTGQDHQCPATGSSSREAWLEYIHTIRWTDGKWQ